MLALGLVGKGHGARAFLHRASTRAVMHDASYWCPMRLSIRHCTLLTLLRPCVYVVSHALLQYIVIPLHEWCITHNHPGLHAITSACKDGSHPGHTPPPRAGTRWYLNSTSCSKRALRDWVL